MDDFNWDCPYCDRSTTITGSNCSKNIHHTGLDAKAGRVSLHTKVILCPNSKCKEYSVSAELYLLKFNGNAYVKQGSPLFEWLLKPKSKSKQFPDYIPKAIRADYEEACLIQDLSPKASATLSRRCLQGMIRDFFDVNERTLFDEINRIKDELEPLTWDAIDAVRSIGNIGAHMEKDINTIIDVDSNEANLLIRLIELLIDDWYVSRHVREESLKSIVDVAKKKKLAKSEKNVTTH